MVIAGECFNWKTSSVFYGLLFKNNVEQIRCFILCVVVDGERRDGGQLCPLGHPKRDRSGHFFHILYVKVIMKIMNFC